MNGKFVSNEEVVYLGSAGLLASVREPYSQNVELNCQNKADDLLHCLEKLIIIYIRNFHCC